MSSTISIISYICCIIDSVIFLSCVIVFLAIYKKKGNLDKEKLNYHLCAAYLIYGLTSLMPAYSLYESGTFSNNALSFISKICTGDLLTIYHFYVYMFSLSLRTSNEQKTKCWVFIYFWSFLFTAPLVQFFLNINYGFFLLLSKYNWVLQFFIYLSKLYDAGVK